LVFSPRKEGEGEGRVVGQPKGRKRVLYSFTKFTEGERGHQPDLLKG